MAFALTVLGFSTSLGQIDIVFEADTIYVTLEEMESNLVEAHGDVTNTSGGHLSLMCTRTFVEQTDPFNYPYVPGEPGSYERFCWGELCYPNGTDASPSNETMLVTIPNGVTNSTFYADLYPNGVTGTTTMEYCFHTVDGTVSACETLTFIVSTQSVETDAAQADAIEAIYPNPLVGNGFVEYNVPAGKTASIVVRDITGRVLATEQNLNSTGKLAINAEEFSAGLCFVSIEIEGSLVATEQFLVIK